jgi:adenine phosphoribosyltransferase
MTANEVIAAIRNVPDFPIPGIQFKDITTALNKPECLKWMRDEIVNRFKNLGITQVVGIESRGFILAPAIAIELGAGFVPIRKHNKLPAETMSVTYKKEYGDDTIQIHKDALSPDDVVLIHDDILATGGSMEAAIELVKKLGVKKVYANCLIELEGLNGRKCLDGKAEDIYCLFGMEVDE